MASSINPTTGLRAPMDTGNQYFTANGALVSKGVEGISVIPARNIGSVGMVGKTITVNDMKCKNLLTINAPTAEMAEKIMLEFFARGL